MKCPKCGKSAELIERKWAGPWGLAQFGYIPWGVEVFGVCSCGFEGAHKYNHNAPAVNGYIEPIERTREEARNAFEAGTPPRQLEKPPARAQ